MTTAVARAEVAKIKAMREAMMQGEPVQSGVAAWWRGLLPSDRQTLLALCGEDDSEQNARRPWLQYLPAARALIVSECQRLHRITNAMRWA